MTLSLADRPVKSGAQFFRFGDYQCIVDISFWDDVIKLKLAHWKLSCPNVPLTAYLQYPNVLRVNRNSLPTAARRLLSGGAEPPPQPPEGVAVSGAFHHTNSWEEFCALTFNELALGTISPLRTAVAMNLAGGGGAAAADAHLLLPFTIVAYMDLKEYVMRYAVSIGTVGAVRFELIEFLDHQQPPPLACRQAIAVHCDEDESGVVELVLPEHAHLNLYARNVIMAHCPLDGREFVVRSAVPGAEGRWQTHRMRAFVNSAEEITSPIIAGWLRRKLQKPAETTSASAVRHLPAQCIFQLDLQSFLSSKVVQQNATELNVRLIKWRIIPEFDPELIQKLRVLVIGMGTLGCFICRELIGWGVCHFTLIDCGVVSPSNPARQCLYISSDVGGNRVSSSSGGEGLAENTRKCKVHVAKSRLLEIRPDLDVQALDWEIPMPNQSRFNLPVRNFIPDSSAEEADEIYSEWITRKLTKLVEENHVVWLLTDNRESRWLPSLIVQHQSYRLAREAPPTPSLGELSSPREITAVDQISESDVTTAPAQTLLTHLLAAEHTGETDSENHGPPSNAKAPPFNPAVAPPVDLYRKQNAFSPPLCYTVALGFDTFVAMRHGTYVDSPVAREFEDLTAPYDVFGGRLSCYFCNDLSAPAGGHGRRALDQQCTVTRNGVAGWAAALAVEAVASLTQADYAWGAAPPDRIREARSKIGQMGPDERLGAEKVRHVRKWLTENPRHRSCLGESPHVIRGSLSNFSLSHNWHPAFPQCVCCSTGVLEAYSKYGEKFVSSVVRDASQLEDVSGINEFRCQTVIQEDVVLSFTKIVESDGE